MKLGKSDTGRGTITIGSSRNPLTLGPLVHVHRFSSIRLSPSISSGVSLGAGSLTKLSDRSGTEQFFPSGELHSRDVSV